MIWLPSSGGGVAGEFFHRANGTAPGTRRGYSMCLWGSITSVRVFGLIVSVLLSIVYALARTVLRLLVLRGRGEAAKDVGLLVLRHGVTVLRLAGQSAAVGGEGSDAVGRAVGCAASAVVAEPDRQCGDAAALAS